MYDNLNQLFEFCMNQKWEGGPYTFKHILSPIPTKIEQENITKPGEHGLWLEFRVSSCGRDSELRIVALYFTPKSDWNPMRINEFEKVRLEGGEGGMANELMRRLQVYLTTGYAERRALEFVKFIPLR